MLQTLFAFSCLPFCCLVSVKFARLHELANRASLACLFEDDTCWVPSVTCSLGFPARSQHVRIGLATLPEA